MHNLRDWHTLSIQRIVSVSTSGNGRVGEWATQWYTWWGEAPEETENINEGADVGKFRRCARPIRVPSLGSLVSLVSRFSRNGVDCLQNAPSLRSRDSRGSASELVQPIRLGLSRPNSFVKIIELFRSLAPLWCCQATQRVFSGFSCFVGQRSCQIFGIRESSEVCDPLGRFLLWLKSSSSSGTRQPPIRHVRGDSARCSIRIAQEERARPIYQRALKAQGRARARAAPKSRDLKFF